MVSISPYLQHAGRWLEHIPRECDRVARVTSSISESDTPRGDGDDPSTARAQKAAAGAGASQSPRPVSGYASLRWQWPGLTERAVSASGQGEVAEGGSGGRRLGQEVFAARVFQDCVRARRIRRIR